VPPNPVLWDGISLGFADDDDSIPNVFLVPFDFVSFQQGAQLILESNVAVMLLLSGDVLLHLFEVEIRVKRVACGFVAQERPAVFGREDEMNVNGGKRLWHVGKMPNRKRFASVNRRCESVFNPKRIASISPGLRGTSYPGSSSNKHSEPQRGCVHFVSSMRAMLATTPLGLRLSSDVFPR